MKNYKILILIAIILTLSVFLIRDNNQYNKTIIEYQNRENQLRNELRRSIANNTELEEMYLELRQEKIELRQANKEITEWKEFICTGYSANDREQGTNDITATGFKTDCGLPIVAVDPKVIEPYSVVEIKGYGGFIALDVGGAIRGNKIDILFNSKDEALDFGIQKLMVRVLK